MSHSTSQLVQAFVDKLTCFILDFILNDMGSYE
jgi:hypothetical protein